MENTAGSVQTGKQKTYVCIDLKSFYASVECRERGTGPHDHQPGGG